MRTPITRFTPSACLLAPAMLAICLALAACAGAPATPGSGPDEAGTLLPSDRDVALWGPGPDNGRY